jgi:hypothetical protein
MAILLAIEEKTSAPWVPLLKQAKHETAFVRAELIDNCRALGLQENPELGPLLKELLELTLAGAEAKAGDSSVSLARLFKAFRAGEDFARAAKALNLALSAKDFDGELDLPGWIGKRGAGLPALVQLLVDHLEEDMNKEPPVTRRDALVTLFRHAADLVSAQRNRLEFAHLAEAFALSKLPDDLGSWVTIVRTFVHNTRL